MKKQITTRRLLLSAFCSEEFTHDELMSLKHKAWKKNLGVLMSNVSNSKLGQSVTLFDCYKVEELSFYKRLRHYLRVCLTAVSRYVGMSPVITVIKFR